MPSKDYDDLAGEDIIDSRDLIEALEDLRYQLDDETLNTEEREDIAARIAEIEGLEDSADDWTYGATLVRDRYFEDYARELADDIGAIDANAAWPMSCIDWEQAARELAMDYTSVTFAGHDYYVR